MPAIIVDDTVVGVTVGTEGPEAGCGVDGAVACPAVVESRLSNCCTHPGVADTLLFPPVAPEFEEDEPPPGIGGTGCANAAGCTVPAG